MTTQTQERPAAVEQQDRLEPGSGISTVVITSWGESKAKRGEGFDILLNISVKLEAPDADQIGALYFASKSAQSLYLETVADIVTVSSVKGARETVTAVLVMKNPDKHALGRVLDMDYTQRGVALFEAQLGMQGIGDDQGADNPSMFDDDGLLNAHRGGGGDADPSDPNTDSE